MGNSASALPYSIGKQVHGTTQDGWAWMEGSRKSDGAAVTVFQAKKPVLQKTAVDKRKAPQLTQLAPAHHHFRNCKKLRHPHILQVYATLDTDHPNDSVSTASAASSSSTDRKTSETGDWIIVTEPCQPFETWLASRPDPELVAWGLESAVRALHFLHASAGLVHANVCPTSFCVTPAGDVKLWSFSLVTDPANLTSHFYDYEGVVTPQAYRSPERVQRQWEALKQPGSTHAMDSFSLGVWIQHLFHNQVPQPLQKAVQRLQTPNVKMRPRLQPLLKCPIFDTPYQKLQLQLEEIAVQPVEEKISFWQNLTPNMQAGLIPSAMSVHRLLPLIQLTIRTICESDSMKAQDLYRREVLAMMAPMFYICESFLDEKQAGKELGPTVSTLFGVTDRAIRGSLLKKAPLICKTLDKSTLNQSVFEPTCSGFSDSSAALRELTLKACLEFVPVLNQPNLEKLSRYLVRLQGDQEATIRTNTIFFFAKLAPHLTEMTREKMLLPALARATKDPFTPCRLAALKATLAAKDLFPVQVLATKVLPGVSPVLLDPSADVRREAFAAVDQLLFCLRQESERLNALPDPTVAPTQAQTGTTPTTAPAPAAPRSAPPPAVANTITTPTASSVAGSQSAAAAAAAPKSGGWMSSWMSTGAPAPAAAAPAATAPSYGAAQQALSYGATPAAATPHGGAAPTYGAAQQPSPTVAMQSLTLSGDNDGWGEDDDDVDLLDMNDPFAPSSNSAPAMNFGAPAPAMNFGAPAPAMNSYGAPAPAMNSYGAPAPAMNSYGAPAPAMNSYGAPAPAMNYGASNQGSLFTPAAVPASNDDFFGAFDSKPAKPVTMKKTGGKLVVPNKKAAPVVKKLSVDKVMDGWDDF